MNRIHPTATIDPAAAIGDGCTIGAYTVIGPEAVVGDDCVIGPHCVIHGRVAIGAKNTFISQAAVGGPPQDTSYKGEPTGLVIGSGNTFREFVTLNRGTAKGGGTTRIGDNNLMMAYAHIAHDCLVGDNTVFANAATLAGHVEVGNHATIGAFSAVHQFCRIGNYAFIGGFSVITKDAMPFIKTVGARSEARLFGINTIGLERKGFSPETISSLKAAYHTLFLSKKLLKEAVEELEEEDSGNACAEVRHLLDFIKSSTRGIQR